MFYGTAFISENALLCATWALGCLSMSIFTLLPAIKAEDPNLILLGGALILTVGVGYLALEKSLLVQAAPNKEGLGAKKADGISRSILGVQVSLPLYCTRAGVGVSAEARTTLLTERWQVGLVALAMLVTRSSVASLQAKQGLPLGTQMVGWFTLGKYIFSSALCGDLRLAWFE